MNTAHFLELISERTGDVISIYTLEWKYLLISPSCKNILGYKPDELIGRSIYEKIHPEDLNRILGNTKELSTSYKTQFLTYRMQRKDGIYIWVETTLHRLDDQELSSESLIIAVSRDVTTRKSSEEMVKKFVEGVEYASDCIVMSNPEGQIMYVNPAVKAITGYSPEEVIGQHANMIWGGLEDANAIVNMWTTLQDQKKPYSGEISNITKDGRTYYTEAHISPIFDQNKEITFLVGISRDITKSKEIDKMKNEFISLASHQLRTPLTAIKWRIEMLMDEDFKILSKEQQKYIHEINRSNERMIELVNSLLNISRIESGRLIVDPKMTSLEDLMLSSIDDFENKIKEKNIKIKLSFQTNVYDVSVDPHLIRNVYINLLSNAIKYTPNNGNIEVAIYTEGDKIITKVKDSGYGIPKAQQNQIFDKFFRASNIRKIETEGTGLGLYLVKAILNASDGNIWFESEENKGTTFYVSLNMSGVEPKKGDVTIST